MCSVYYLSIRLFCSDRKKLIGTIKCSVCAASFQMPLGGLFLETVWFIALTAPVDIYAKWIDELEKANANPGDLDDLEHDELSENSEQDDY